MKNYLKLSNLSETITSILPFSCKKSGKKVNKELPFVVLNSDDDYGFYVKRLAKEIAKFDLIEQPKILRKKSLKNIETGDLIVFGDVVGRVEYDFRVETDPKSLDHLDGRKFKVYDIILDFDKVLKRLAKYAAENSEEYFLVKEKKEPKELEVNVYNVDVTVSSKRPRYTVPLAILHNHVADQKVHIFDNWVKIGYNQYDIYTNLFGEEFIYVNGNKFFINEDRFGRKYLVR